MLARTIYIWVAMMTTITLVATIPILVMRLQRNHGDNCYDANATQAPQTNAEP